MQNVWILSVTSVLIDSLNFQESLFIICEKFGSKVRSKEFVVFFGQAEG